MVGPGGDGDPPRPRFQGPSIGRKEVEVQSVQCPSGRAALAGIILALGVGRAAPAGAAPPEAREVVVAADASSDFRTVQEAVDAVPAGNSERFVIRIRPGTYKGRVVVPPNKPFVSFLGEDAERTIL